MCLCVSFGVSVWGRGGVVKDSAVIMSPIMKGDVDLYFWQDISILGLKRIDKKDRHILFLF